MAVIRDALLMMRPANCLMTGAAVVFSYIVLGGVSDTLIAAVGFLTGLLVCGASMYINDIVDAGADAINKPWKPIPSGRVSASMAKKLFLVFSLLAVLLNIYLGAAAVLVVVLYSLVAYGYSFARRYWWSHFLVSIGTTAPFIYGYVLAGMPGDRLLFIACFTLTVFLINTGREFVKSVSDVEGDRAAGYSTIAIRYGVTAASRLPVFLGVVGGAVALLPYFYGVAGPVYAILIIVADAAYLYYAVGFMRSPSREKSFWAKKGMLGAYAIALAGFLLSNL